MKYFNNSIPSFIIQGTCDQINVDQEIFNSLRQDYPGFNDWFARISREKRNVLYFGPINNIEGILIWKVEDHSPIDGSAQRWLKICTLKFIDSGKRQAELFLKYIFEYAIETNCEYIYCTSYEKQTSLIYILTKFGFQFIQRMENEELIYGRKIRLDFFNVWEFNKNSWPYFGLDEHTSFYIIPIKPEYHDRFFPENNQTRGLPVFKPDDVALSGFGIDKAYITHSKIQKLKTGDMIIFYKSESQILSVLGFIEKVVTPQSTYNSVRSILHKRNAYTQRELRSEIEKGPCTIIFFRVFICLEPIFNYKWLFDNEILNGPPQSIVEISKEKYQKIKNNSEKIQYFQIN